MLFVGLSISNDSNSKFALLRLIERFRRAETLWHTLQFEWIGVRGVMKIYIYWLKIGSEWRRLLAIGLNCGVIGVLLFEGKLQLRQHGEDQQKY